MQINSLLNAYIDANILLLFAFSLWTVARYILKISGMPNAFATQLRLLNGIFLAIAISPFFVLALSAALQSGVVAPDFSVTLSDFVVAQYLNGSFEMKPAQLEQILGLRESLTSGLLGLKSTSGLVIMAFLALGFVVTAARMVASVLRLRRIIRSSYAWRRFGNVHLLLSDAVHVPFSTRDHRNHYIIIPSGMLAQGDDIKMALGHEFQHLRQGDIEWEIALEFLKPFFFWNPAYFLWKRQVERLRELTCDQQLLSRRGYDVAAYCECLLRVCHSSLRKDPERQIVVPSVALVQVDSSLMGANSVRFLKHRLVSIFDAGSDHKPNTVFRVLMVPLVAVILFASVTIQKPSDWSQDRLMLSTIINLERLEARNNGGF